MKLQIFWVLFLPYCWFQLMVCEPERAQRVTGRDSSPVPQSKDAFLCPGRPGLWRRARTLSLRFFPVPIPDVQRLVPGTNPASTMTNFGLDCWLGRFLFQNLLVSTPCPSVPLRADLEFSMLLFIHVASYVAAKQRKTAWAAQHRALKTCTMWVS